MGAEATVVAVSPGRRTAVGSVELWVEIHGDGPHPVLLVSGSDSPASRWSDRLVTLLTSAGCRVVMFDHRDCGRSTEVPASTGYTLDDLADDAIGVLDAAGVEGAHVVGHSMGGMVALRLSLDHPGRIRTLTLFGSSPGPDDRLPPPSPGLLVLLEERLWEPIPRDRDGRVRWLVDRQRLYAGPRGIDEERELELARREVDEAWRPETGHGPAVAASASVLDRLTAVAAPTLVVHGAADQLFPPGHAEAIARSIAEAQLLVVPDLGHELPDWLWPVVGPTVLAHLLG